MATFYAYIVRWTKDNPNSPGYAMADKVVDALVSNNANGAIPAEFFNKDIYNSYFDHQVQIESFTDKSPGFVMFVRHKDCSAMVFDSEENLNKYNTDKKQLPGWEAFETARNAFLSLVQTRFDVFPTQTIETNTEDKAEITFTVGARIEQLLTTV